MKLEDILSQVKAVEDKKLKEEHVSGSDDRVLTFKKGATYKGRIVPYIKDVANTFVTWEDVGFNSRAGGGEYVFLGRSPMNAGVSAGKDVIKKVQWDAYSKAKARGDEAEMKLACKLIPNRKQTVNFYLQEVTGDDKAKEHIGKVMALKYPARVDKKKEPTSEIYKTIHGALFGAKASKIGGKALDLSDKGRSLEIVVGSNGEWNTYSASFDDSEDLGLTAAQIKAIHESAHDLTEFVPEVKSDDELKQLLDEHWFAKNAALEDELDESEKPEDDDVDYSPSKSQKGDSTDIDDLLEGID